MSATTTVTLRHRGTGPGIRIDPATGLPDGIVFADGEEVPLHSMVRLTTNGREEASHLGGLRYVDTEEVTELRAVGEPVAADGDAGGSTWMVVAAAGEWEVTIHYRVAATRPRMSLSATLRWRGQGEKGTLRNLQVSIIAEPADLSRWALEAPGNPLRPGIEASTLVEPIEIATPGGLKGSAGMVALHDGDSRCLVLWPLSVTEIGLCTVQTTDRGVRLTLDTELAGRIGRGESLEWGTMFFEAETSGWKAVRSQATSWYPAVGIQVPRDVPDWLSSANIYEAHIGEAPFRHGWRYQPYPTAEDLIDDLGRIADLGFNALQLMPRHPYPSYNVHDYDDLATTYAPKDTLLRLVDECHRRGIRVILDILLHGVIDRVVLAATAQRVREGPLASSLDRPVPVGFPAEQDDVDISWSRHILDFEPSWHAGSPERHPLLDEHPEWFLRDSEQEIIGVYTNGFDLANPAWQDYFCDRAERIAREIGIDGFRFDAPTYNRMGNWSHATESRASRSMLGCLELFEKLRTRLKRLSPSFLLYTEPSGLLFRNALDLTYNYDEQWLINSLVDRRGAVPPAGVRNARELAGWLGERDALLPEGSLIAHHIDSHDTYWWPLPGLKWRREQFGVDAAGALLVVFALSGGAFMSYVGAERGLERLIRRVNRLRTDHPEIATGSIDFDCVQGTDPDVYAVARRSVSATSVILVNLAPATRSTNVTLTDGAALGVTPEAAEHPEVAEALQRAHGVLQLDGLVLEPYQSRLLHFTSGGDRRPVFDTVVLGDAVQDRSVDRPAWDPSSPNGG